MDVFLKTSKVWNSEPSYNQSRGGAEKFSNSACSVESRQKARPVLGKREINPADALVKKGKKTITWPSLFRKTKRRGRAKNAVGAKILKQ